MRARAAKFYKKAANLDQSLEKAKKKAKELKKGGSFWIWLVVTLAAALTLFFLKRRRKN